MAAQEFSPEALTFQGRHWPRALRVGVVLGANILLWLALAAVLKPIL